MNTSKLSFAIAAVLAAPTVVAQPQDRDEEIEMVVVTASPLQSSALEMTQSASVLSGEELDRALQATIGETVGRLPGVQSAYFGPGVGRPIIRGLDGPRIDILENNISSNDVSNVSADHAVSIEPFLAEQVEVLRGPATLIYGSDTIGGVVNVRTHRIPPKPVDGLQGEVVVSGDTVADERFGGVELDFGSGNWAFHVDGFYRDTDDYEIPGFAELEELHDEDHEEDHEDEGHDEEEIAGILENSAVQTRGGAAGVSYIGDGWTLGLAYSNYQTEYGIPGHAHEHGHKDEEDHGEDHGDDHEEGEEEEEFVSIDLENDRMDADFRMDNPLGGVESLRVLLSGSDYEHVELEGAEIGTRFDTDTLEGRVELVHEPIAGWRGVVGLQFSDREFAAFGEEAFVPPSESDALALFLVEEREIDDWRLEFGARLEDRDVDTSDGRSASHEPFSLSAGAVWHFSPETHLALHASRSERAPAEEELFADGPHIATQTFEIGDATLDEEISTNFEITLRRHEGPLTGSLTVFRNDFSDFIFLSDAGQEEDGLPVRFWTQQDAEFTGLEGELRYAFGESDFGRFFARGFFDTVDAELDDGSNLPRIAPARIGAGLDWESGGWAASFNVVRYDDQHDIAEFEIPTDSYTMIDADLAYRLNGAGGVTWEIFARGRNLADQEARNHTSFLKDRAPLPGRNLVLGFRAYF
ncbi:MAG: TonB-dependent receptor [Xanthomonadales bacterium]|nr:TonB-dependent receptor [Xanthomonadales bacterium]